ncbi:MULTISPECIES: restriction endonuclease subunit S [unclassified Cellulophaga]|uniref:restriction endonuclease subunit S n=1 Tax=unclassified Cellulophaga TaxID=2634405 RepID=UPI0026E2BA35|nr:MULTISPECIES: restriction endonuclease subunit S [unclassified Cellulophaga]MDO6490172.1 restriction endonuclease subunit S [Cellulophaga sp. 2_MG-2023]MDO6494634.1 restriction endonuclease subunit S [Cellulophaga sp. 3_MG-2023]
MSGVNEIPNNWVATTLGDSISIFSGKTRPKSEGNYPVYGGNGIHSYGNKYNYENETIIIGRVGAYCGNVFKEENKFWLSDNALGIKPNENSDFKYLFYKLKDMKLNNVSIGAAQPLLTQSLLKELEIITPKNIAEQKAIANILTAFDDKIENLQAQNKSLETTAQTIFKEWFGKYQIGDELPDNWKILSIEELVDIIIDYRGKTPKKLGMDWSESGIPALSAKTIKKGKIVRRDAMNFGDEALYDLWMKDELQKGDILLTSEAPLGEMYYINDDKKYILSQRLFALRVNENITSQYLYHYLFSRYGQHLLQARASGSTVEGIRQSELRKIEVIIPDSDSLEKASSLFQNIFDKKHNNSKQIQSLKETRNELLPKLMSGEIRIKEFIK